MLPCILRLLEAHYEYSNDLITLSLTFPNIIFILLQVSKMTHIFIPINHHPKEQLHTFHFYCNPSLSFLFTVVTKYILGG